MTVEQLLQPRYKVIAPYPEIQRHSINVGDILTTHPTECTRNQNGDARFTFEWGMFPHLFKKLEWWEERATDEMPEYLRHAKNGHVINVAQWEGFNIKGIPLFDYRISSQHPWTRGLATEWLPATKEEYEAFLSTTSSPKQ